MSGDGTHHYEADDNAVVRRCGNCDNCMRENGRATRDLGLETSQPIDDAILEALSEVDRETKFKRVQRDQARAARRGRRDDARVRRQQLASAAERRN